jgi:hypothetical protein
MELARRAKSFTMGSMGNMQAKLFQTDLCASAASA